MGKRKIIIKKSAAHQIAEIAWYIEAKGLVKTAEKFSNNVYDFIEKIADSRRIHGICRDPLRATIGYKCVPYKKNFTLIFLETTLEITICEFLPSKLINF